MFRLVLVSALVALVAGAPNVRPIASVLDGRVIGGQPTDIKEVPYQLSLLRYGTHICGASIIGRRRALTAAHCTYGSAAPSLSIRSGSTYREAAGQVSQVTDIFQHPSYNPQTIDYDVSILIISGGIPLDSTSQPIALQRVDEELADGTLAVVSGWGSVWSGGSPSVYLQMVEVPKVSDNFCKYAYGPNSITARMTCHGFAEGGKSSCQGDSGGPLVVGGKQVGIVSWSGGCAEPGLPGVYTKIANSEIQTYIKNSV